MSDKIQRSDIEEKLRQIKGQVDDSASASKPAAATIGTGVMVGAVGLAYLIGQRKARKRSTVVEIRRE